MARLPRLIVPGQVHHVLQRSNGGQVAFVDTQDHQAMLDLLAEYTQAFGVAVHAYVLMPTYWHLLATPDTAEGLPAMVQAVGRRYVRQFNQRHGRRGGLWEGRFRSTVVEAGQHLLPGMVWIDTAPLRDGLLADNAEAYPWSGCACSMGLRTDRLIKPHALYWALGNTPFAREAAYAEMVRAGNTRAEALLLADAIPKGWALGGAAFVAALQQETGQRVAKVRPGRPRMREISPSK